MDFNHFYDFVSLLGSGFVVQQTSLCVEATRSPRGSAEWESYPACALCPLLVSTLLLRSLLGPGQLPCPAAGSGAVSFRRQSLPPMPVGANLPLGWPRQKLLRGAGPVVQAAWSWALWSPDRPARSIEEVTTPPQPLTLYDVSLTSALRRQGPGCPGSHYAPSTQLVPDVGRCLDDICGTNGWQDCEERGIYGCISLPGSLPANPLVVQTDPAQWF